MFRSLFSRVFVFLSLLLVAGLLPAQQKIGGSGSRVGGASATGDVLCRSSTGTVAACATLDFVWNSGLIVDAGPITLDPDGTFGAGSGVCFGDGDTCIYEDSDDSLELSFAGSNAWNIIAQYIFGQQPSSATIGSLTGTAAAPSFTFSTETNTGWWRIGVGNIGFSSSGNKFFEIGGSFTASFRDTTTTTGATRVQIDQGDADSDQTVLLTVAGAVTAKTGGSVPACEKYTKTAADLTTASGTEDEVLFNLPARGKLTGVNIKHTLAFSGGTLSAMTVSVGDSSSTTFYTSALDIFQAVSDTTFLDADMFLSSTFASRDVLARFTATGDTMDNVTAGSVDIHVCWVALP